jgi:hypothetical protein
MGMERINGDTEKLIHLDTTNLGGILRANPYTLIDRTENGGLANWLRGIKPIKIVGVDMSDETLAGKLVLESTAKHLLERDSINAGDIRVNVRTEHIIFRSKKIRSEFIKSLPDKIHVTR